MAVGIETMEGRRGARGIVREPEGRQVLGTAGNRLAEVGKVTCKGKLGRVGEQREVRIVADEGVRRGIEVGCVGNAGLLSSLAQDGADDRRGISEGFRANHYRMGESPKRRKNETQD